MSKRKTAPIQNRLSDWRIMRRKGRMVRYQNMVTAEWDGWQMDPEAPALSPLDRMRLNGAYGQPRINLKTQAQLKAMKPVLLDMMTLTTLKALADAQGVSYTSRTRKPALIELLSV